MHAIIIIKLSRVPKKKNFAQKRVKEKSLVVINLEQICLDVIFNVYL